MKVIRNLPGDYYNTYEDEPKPGAETDAVNSLPADLRDGELLRAEHNLARYFVSNEDKRECPTCNLEYLSHMYANTKRGTCRYLTCDCGGRWFFLRDLF